MDELVLSSSWELLVVGAWKIDAAIHAGDSGERLRSLVVQYWTEGFSLGDALDDP